MLKIAKVKKNIQQLQCIIEYRLVFSISIICFFFKICWLSDNCVNTINDRFSCRNAFRNYTSNVNRYSKWFNFKFFFILPLTLFIYNTETYCCFWCIFIIALANAVWPLKFEGKWARDKKEKKNYKTLQYTITHYLMRLRTPIATIIVAIDHLKKIKQTIRSESNCST
jgi:hypothetical protein